MSDALFLREAARYLRDVHLPRLAEAARTLPAEDLWWRPHAEAIAVGTILLHLEGNVRQWILAGLGGAADARDRASEFAATGGPDREVLLTRLAATVEEAARTLAGLPAGGLDDEVTIQGFATTRLGAALHVVEHFAWHVGQAVWIAKARGGPGHGLAFYDDARL